MSEPSTEAGEARRFGAGRRGAVAVGIVLLAALTAVAHAPGTFRNLNAQAVKNDAYHGIGGTLASADSLDIDNGIVGSALDVLPRDATFAVDPPTQRFVRAQHVAPLTVEALAPYLRSILLPRREVDDASAQYVLCYGCNTQPWRGRIRWIWTDDTGLKIGRVRGAT